MFALKAGAGGDVGPSCAPLGRRGLPCTWSCAAPVLPPSCLTPPLHEAPNLVPPNKDVWHGAALGSVTARTRIPGVSRALPRPRTGLPGGLLAVGAPSCGKSIAPYGPVPREVRFSASSYNSELFAALGRGFLSASPSFLLTRWKRVCGRDASPVRGVGLTARRRFSFRCFSVRADRLGGTASPAARGWPLLAIHSAAVRVTPGFLPAVRGGRMASRGSVSTCNFALLV